MGDDSPTPNLVYAWQEQKLWSGTANKLKTRISLSRSFALWLGIAAAALAASAIAVQNVDANLTKLLTLAAAASAALVPFVQRGAATEKVHAWTRARSASEGLKTLVYVYLANTGSSDDHTTAMELGEDARTIVSAVSDLERYTGDISRDPGPLPEVHDLDTYIDKRVDDQINWYRKKGFGYERVVSRLRIAGNVLAALAALIGVAAATLDNESIAIWIPFVTTVGSSLLAHIAASRYDHMIIEYLRTAQQLEHLRLTRVDKDMSDDDFVAACEAAISVENQGWMTKWNDPKTENDDAV